MKYLVIFLSIALIATGSIFLYVKNQQKNVNRELAKENATIPLVPITKSPEIPADIAAHIKSKIDRIVLESPAPYATIDSPVALKGKARGNWFFEASFPVNVVNWDGLIIGQGIATADGEWMTSEFVPFTANITYTEDTNAYSQNGTLILKKDNPSGLSENDDALEIPIILKK